MNKNKVKGTAAELTALKKIKERIANENCIIIKPRLNGIKDIGDIIILEDNSKALIVEVKSYKRFSKSNIEKWWREACTESDNAYSYFNNKKECIPALAIKLNGTNGFIMTYDCVNWEVML